MNQPDPARVQQIVAEATDLQAAARKVFIQQACVDDAALLAAVESRLDSARAVPAGEFISESVAGPTLGSATIDPLQSFTRDTEPLESLIGGRYKLLERIGEGGFGIVYVAEQTSPIKRRVALKIIKAGMDTRQVVARFEAERQALAMMDHPNIARVLDAGATDSGRPYFVMELVRGISITQFCDENKLTPRQRVELLVPICQAVQHAHQKGIIHRDIKPQNVLVTLHDGAPVPKVIDFGIAKATSQSLTEKTVYTEFRQMIGTPAYMSPEQAEMSGLDVDTRSDIYSLGVLAYELLTGTTPFDAVRLVEAGLIEIQRIIRDEEPPRPSIRINTMGQSLPTVASQRSIEPSRLRKEVAGELDWIVMKAMEKDRTRRYETAQAFGEDLTRHLKGLPVHAAPPSLAYRSMKLLRRYKLPAVAIGLVALTMIAATVISLVFFLRANRLAKSETTQRQIAEQRTRESLAAEQDARRQKMQADHDRGAAQESLIRSLLAQHDSAVSVGDFKSASASVRDAVAVNDKLNEPMRSMELAAFEALSHSPPELNCLRGHEGHVFGIHGLNDPRQLVSTGADGTLRYWDMPTGRLLSSAQPTGSPSSLTLIGTVYENRAILLGSGGRVLLVDAATGRTLFRSESEHRDRIVRGEVAPDGKTFAVGSWDGSATLWSVDPIRMIKRLEGHHAKVWFVNYSRDSKRLLTGGDDPFVLVHDLAGNGKPARVNTGEAARSALFDADDKSVLVGSSVVTRFMPDGQSLPVEQSIRGTASAWWSSRWISDDRLMTGDTDGSIRLWKSQGHKLDLIQAFTGHEDSIREAVMLEDAGIVASCSADKTIRLWAANGPTWNRSSPDESLSADGIFSAERRASEIVLKDAAGGIDLDRWTVPEKVYSLAFSEQPFGLLAATASGAVWLEPARKPIRIDLPVKPVTKCFIDSGIVVASAGGNLSFIDLGAATAIGEASLPNGVRVNKISVSRNGKLLAANCNLNGVYIVDVAQRKVIHHIVADDPVRSAYCAAFLDDDRSLLVGGLPGKVAKLGIDQRSLSAGAVVRSTDVSIADLRLLDDGRLVTLDYDGVLTVTTLGNPSDSRSMRSNRRASEVQIARDGSRALIHLGSDGNRLYDLAAAKEVAALRPKMSSYFKAISDNPADGAACAAIALWYTYEGVPSWATMLFSRAQSLGSSTDAMQQTRCLYKLGRYSEALSVLERPSSAAINERLRSLLRARLLQLERESDKSPASKPADAGSKALGPHLVAARLAATEHDWALAAREYQLAADAGDEITSTERAIDCWQSGRLHEATIAFEGALQAGEANPGWLNLCIAAASVPDPAQPPASKPTK